MARKDITEKHFWMKFDMGDWLTDPALMLASPGARGFWIDLICHMGKARCAELIATPSEFARLGRCEEKEAAKFLKELQRRRIADVEECEGKFAVLCRRIQKELDISAVRSSAANSRYSKAPAKSVQNPDSSFNSSSAFEGEMQEGPDVEEIVCAHPLSVSRNLQPLQVTQAQAAAVVEALAGGETRAELLAKVKAIAAIVLTEWPPAERRFLPKVENFFRQHEYNRPLDEWRRGGKGFSEARVGVAIPRSAEEIDEEMAKRQAADAEQREMVLEHHRNRKKRHPDTWRKGVDAWVLKALDAEQQEARTG